MTFLEKFIVCKSLFFKIRSTGFITVDGILKQYFCVCNILPKKWFSL